MSATAPSIHGDNTPPGFREWEEQGSQLIIDLSQAEHRTTSLQFTLGDWYAKGEATFGEAASQGIPESTYARKTILNCARVARRIPGHRRRAELTFGHHDAVAGIEDEDAQDRWLQWAIDHEATVAELRDAIRQERDGGGGSGDGGGDEEREVRLELEEGDGGEVDVYEVSFDLTTGDEDRTHVATFYAAVDSSGESRAGWYAQCLLDGHRKAKK